MGFVIFKQEPKNKIKTDPNYYSEGRSGPISIPVLGKKAAVRVYIEADPKAGTCTVLTADGFDKLCTLNTLKKADVEKAMRALANLRRIYDELPNLFAGVDLDLVVKLPK